MHEPRTLSCLATTSPPPAWPQPMKPLCQQMTPSTPLSMKTQDAYAKAFTPPTSHPPQDDQYHEQSRITWTVSLAFDNSQSAVRAHGLSRRQYKSVHDPLFSCPFFLHLINKIVDFWYLNSNFLHLIKAFGYTFTSITVGLSGLDLPSASYIEDLRNTFTTINSSRLERNLLNSFLQHV